MYFSFTGTSHYCQSDMCVSPLCMVVVMVGVHVYFIYMNESYTPVHVEARGGQWMFSSIAFFILLRQSVSLNWRLAFWLGQASLADCLASELSGSICLRLPVPRGTGACSHASCFLRISKIQTQVLMLAHVFPLNLSPASA